MKKSKITNQVGQDTNGISEDRLLSICHQWLWNEHPETRLLCWHIANERKQSAAQGAILKSKGVIAGVPDYVVNWKGNTYYFEFKSTKGKQSEKQKEVEELLGLHGFLYLIVKDFETFKYNIGKILEL